MLRPALTALALLFALPVTAQIYQWKDADGRTHYSDTPPPSGEVKTLRGAAPQNHTPIMDATTDAEVVADSEAEDRSPEAQFRARRAAAAAAEEETAAAAAREAERERFCAEVRNQLKGLQSGLRIGRMNAAGERDFLTDAERSAEISRLQQQLAEHCG